MWNSWAIITDFVGQPMEAWISDNDVVIRNIIHRKEHFNLIDYSLTTLLQLQSKNILTTTLNYESNIGIFKYGEKISLSELTNRLDGELNQIVTSFKDANDWEIANEKMWLEKFYAD
ncbi:10038_t:CDS:2, partial [Diversispora eburnea]